MDRTLTMGLVLLAALALACSDESSEQTASPNATSSNASSSSAGGAVGSGGNGGSVGTGGSGGMPFVDPIAGIGTPQLVMGGYSFTEGPCWFAGPQVLRFTDIPNSVILEVDLQDSVTTWRSNTGRANGIATDAQGRIYACEGGNRIVTRATNASDEQPVADMYLGDRFNAPNDVIVRSDGTFYFTDPDYTVNGPKELTFQGVFRVDTNGMVHLVDDTMARPNGIALSPDESKLYVTDEPADELWVFDVAADGTTSNKTKLADTTNNPDGFAVDDQGYLYITVQDQIDVLRPDGSLHGTIPVPEWPANCTFGGADRRTLYITARTGLYKVTLNVPGLP